MKRILHVKECMRRRGSQAMIMSLYRAIDRTKYQFDFMVFSEEECDYDEEIESLGGEIHRIKAKNWIGRVKEITELLKNNPQWETIHCHMLFANAFLIYAAYKAGVKQRVSHSHRISALKLNRFVSYVYHNISRLIQKKYSTDFLACNKAAGEYLFPDNENVVILANAMDTEEIANYADENVGFLRKEYNLPQDLIVLIKTVRFSPEKNHFFSIKIVKAMKENGVKVKLFLAGEGELKEEVENQVHQLNLDEEVVFMGLRKDVHKFLGSADLMLVPSIHESFPVVLVESQSAGVPALVSDSVPSDVDLGLDLVFFESLKKSPEVWANHILKIISKTTPPKEKRIKILKEKGFDIDSSVKRLINIYSRFNYDK